jgi:exonuclease SbcD
VGKTEHIRYCGSPIALSFDEANQDKRVLLVDFKENNLSSVTDVIVPCFQPLAMVKTSLDKLSQEVENLLAALKLSHNSSTNDNQNSNQKLWLDIELDDSDRLSDLQSRIASLVEDFPVEILLVRRAKQVRQQLMQAQQDNSTLSELTLDEVFASRLQQEGYFSPVTLNAAEDESNKPKIDKNSDDDIDNNKVLEHKQRLQTLFKQTVAQVLAKEST